MSDNWNTYFTSIDNKPASFLLDLDPWNNVENEGLEYLYRLSATLNEPTEDGLTTQQEATVLYVAEDSINDSLDRNYVYIGRITTGGRRDFFYYTDSADGSELEQIAAKSLVKYKYSLNRIHEQKPREFYYASLYPKEADRHRMTNRQLVDQLGELGDNLQKPRTVTHWIYFDSAESRNLCKEKIQRERYHTEDQVTEDGRYSLVVSRNDSVQLHAINSVTDYLVSVTQEHRGNYDGWQAKVIKEQDGFLGGLKRMFKSKK